MSNLDIDSSGDGMIATYLVVDTAGFVAGNLQQLYSMADHIVTLSDVIDEIRDRATKQAIKMLPFDIQYISPSSEALHTVAEFAKRTGDFFALSVTDLKVLAVTLMLELQHCSDTSHINTQLALSCVDKTVSYYKSGPFKKITRSKQLSKDTEITGFFLPPPLEQKDFNADKPLEDIFNEFNLNNVDDVDGEYFIESWKQDEENDIGWVTPGNIKDIYNNEVQKLAASNQFKVTTACLTTDFAMQNILKQMGLGVISLNGRFIRETKTWLLRCYACFRTTPFLDRRFCPKCGHATLKRVAVTVDENGHQNIHISTRIPLSKRGKKFSLPKPRGGKHAINPILVHDPLQSQRLNKLGLKKTCVLDDDEFCTTGKSPFMLHDVTSRSVIVSGKVSSHHRSKMNLYWMKKNPNEVSKKTGNRKKKRRNN